MRPGSRRPSPRATHLLVTIVESLAIPQALPYARFRDFFAKCFTRHLDASGALRHARIVMSSS